MTALLDLPPVTGRWSLLSSPGNVAFRGRTSRFLPTVQARFTDVTGTVEEQAVAVDVDVRSMTTGNAAYDEVVAALDPFDAQRHPVARYRSSGVQWRGSEAFVAGSLSLRGRSAPVQLVASWHPVDGDRVRLTAHGRVDRRDFGLRLEVPGCAALVPHHLDLTIDVVAARQPAG